MSDEKTEAPKNIYAYMLPQLPVSNAVALKLMLGMCALLTLPIWGCAAFILGVVWLAWALGKMLAEYAEKGALAWAKKQAGVDEPKKPEPRIYQQSKEEQPV